MVFNDLDSSENGLAPYLLFALITLLLGLAIYVVISYMLASMALKPIEESWSKQKQFVADASHELKTPLSVIMANTEIIASHGSETVDSQMRWIENTREESARMAELVASLLFLAKNDDGLKVELKTVNLSDCVSTTVLGQDAVFYENGKKFDYSLAGDITVLGNETQLKQLVTDFVGQRQQVFAWGWQYRVDVDGKRTARRHHGVQRQRAIDRRATVALV